MNHNRIGSCSKSFNTRASFWAHLDTPTKVRPKRAPFAELESSANPQPGKAALRSARFLACGFWRLSSRQMVVLSRCAPSYGVFHLQLRLQNRSECRDAPNLIGDMIVKMKNSFGGAP